MKIVSRPIDVGFCSKCGKAGKILVIDTETDEFTVDCPVHGESKGKSETYI